MGVEMPAGAPFPEPNPNLEYAPEYLELQAALRGKPERQFGDKVEAAEGPEWDAVAGLVGALAHRTRDLFVEVTRARAEAHRRGLDGLASAWRHLADLIALDWNALQPLPDEGNGSQIRRLNILAALTAHEEGVADLRAAAWISVAGFGTCLIGQAEKVLGGETVTASDNDETVDRRRLAAFVRASAAGGQQNGAQLALDALQMLDSAMVKQIGEEHAIDLAPLTRILRPIAVFYAAEAAPAIEASQLPVGSSHDGDSSAQPSHTKASSRIGVTSREDVVQALDEVCAYLEVAEPTNPAPLLLRRAQRLLQMSFVDIVREMAPEGMGSLDKVLGPFPQRDE